MFDKISSFLANIFGTKSERDLKKIWPIVDEINEHYEKMEELSDEELKQKTESFKKQISEATREVSEEIASVKKTLNSNEELSVDRRRELAEELNELEEEHIDTIEDVLDDILPEAFAVMKKGEHL